MMSPQPLLGPVLCRILDAIFREKAFPHTLANKGLTEARGHSGGNMQIQIKGVARKDTEVWAREPRMPWQCSLSETG